MALLFINTIAFKCPFRPTTCRLDHETHWLITSPSLSLSPDFSLRHEPGFLEVFGVASYRDLVTIDVVDAVAVAAILRAVEVIIQIELCNQMQMNQVLFLLVAVDLDDLAAVAAVHCGRYSAGSMSAAVVVEEAELPKYLDCMIGNCALTQEH